LVKILSELKFRILGSKEKSISCPSSVAYAAYLHPLFAAEVECACASIALESKARQLALDLRPSNI
jgi:hypothetical protein